MNSIITHTTPERFSTDPRDRLAAGHIPSFPAACRAVEAGCQMEQRELTDSYGRDGTQPPPLALLTWTERADRAREARWYYDQAHAALTAQVTRQLTDAGLFDFAEALERGDTSRLGW